MICLVSNSNIVAYTLLYSSRLFKLLTHESNICEQVSLKRSRTVNAYKP